MSYGKFYDLHAKILAELSNGELAEVITAIENECKFEAHIEDMHPDGIGYYQEYIDFDINEKETILTYPDEWEFVDKNKSMNGYENIVISRIIEIKDVDWKLEP